MYPDHFHSRLWSHYSRKTNKRNGTDLTAFSASNPADVRCASCIDLDHNRSIRIGIGIGIGIGTSIGTSIGIGIGIVAFAGELTAGPLRQRLTAVVDLDPRYLHPLLSTNAIDVAFAIGLCVVVVVLVVVVVVVVVVVAVVVVVVVDIS